MTAGVSLPTTNVALEAGSRVPKSGAKGELK